jgi:hypothetical protein
MAFKGFVINTKPKEIEMYILNKDYDHLERLFNSLDNSRAHDFMELLLIECGKKTGIDEYMIYVRNEKELARLAIAPNHIITREMINNVYQTIAGGI